MAGCVPGVEAEGEPIETEVPATPESELLATAQRFLKDWQPRLRLADWDIWVEVGAVDDNHAAESSVEWRTRRARLILPPDHLQRSRDRGEHSPGTSDDDIVERTVVHELLHVAEQPLADRVQVEIEYWVGTRGQESGIVGAELRNGWRDYREWWINHVTRTLLDGQRNGGWVAEPKPSVMIGPRESCPDTQTR